MTPTGLKQKVARLRQAYAPHEQRPLGGYLAAMGVYATVTAALAGLVRAAGRPVPERPAPADVVLLSIATHKLSRLLSKDAITSPLRAPFTRMVAGIILLALGFKKVLAYVGDESHHRLTDPLHGLGLLALYGGVILYLLGHLGFRLRNMGSVNWPRVVTMLLLVALLPVADHLPALAALGLLAVVCAGMVAAEVVLFGEARRALRDAFLDEHGAGGPPGR